MGKIDPDEAVAIVAELNSRLSGVDSEHYSVRMGVEHLRNTLEDAGLLSRILAAAKPKGPFPLDLGGNETVRINGDDNFDFCMDGDEIWTMTPDEAMRLWVALAKHWGVDLKRFMSDLNDLTAKDHDICMSACEAHDTLQFILDNAEAMERYT